MDAILAIDQGTTNSKAVLVGTDGQVLARGSAPVGISYPHPGWVEQDPTRIWVSVQEAIAACLARIPGANILGVAISNQRESVTAWDAESGMPLAPVLSWQCRRTAEACTKLARAGHAAQVAALTGLPLDPMFPGPKLRWLADHLPSGRKIRLGTIDSWLIHCLTGGSVHACDASNAARSQLMDLAQQDWSSDLCHLFGVERAFLPEIRDSSDDFGTTCGVSGLSNGTPIRAAIGDSHAALFGHGAFLPGDGKVTFGTGSSIMITLDHFTPPDYGITTTTAWRLGGHPTFALEGNILVSAASLPWMAEILGLPDVAALLSLAQTAESGGPGFVPAFVGLGAPHWNTEARALFSQIDFTTTRAQMARAVTDSIAFQIQDVFASMQKLAPSNLGALCADGGPSQNRFLMQCVANTLGHALKQCDAPEVSALGAAHLAGLSLGVWRDFDDLTRLPRPGQIVPPDKSAQSAATATWRDALSRSTFQPAPCKSE
ncbi:glycerol kinase [Thioclava sp. BHET1]|nr:glycerol kinase [Thioclava sp. BHET1]